MPSIIRSKKTLACSPRYSKESWKHLVQVKILETAGRQEWIPGESVHNPGDDHVDDQPNHDDHDGADDHIGDPFVVRGLLHDRDAQVEEIDAIEAQEAEDG